MPAVSMRAMKSAPPDVRPKLWRVDPWWSLSWFGLAALLGCVVAFGTDAGITLDEQLQVNYGDRVLLWFSSGFEAHGALDYRNLYLYGGLFDLPAQWLSRYSPLGVYDTRHVLTALVAVAAVIAVWKMAALLGGTQAGLISAAFLVTTPAWVGHGLFNPKDIPFGTAAAFAVHACLRILLAPSVLSLRDVLYAGATIGVALGIRPGGVFLFGYLGAAVVGRIALAHLSHAPHAPARAFIGSLRVRPVRLALAFALAWLIMLSAWPWAQISPLLHPLRAMVAASKFSWPGSVLFDGRLISARELPWTYLPTWFLITLPETYAVAFVAALIVAWRTRSQWREALPMVACIGLLCMSATFPVVAIIVRHAVVYDAHRHVLCVLPPLAVLAGCATTALLRSVALPRALRVATAAILAGLALVTWLDMSSLHPYEYTYFNRTFGGLRAAAGRFETDYWGASYREGLAWLFEHARRGTAAKVRVTWCNDAVPLDYYLQTTPSLAARFELDPTLSKPDYWLGTTRYLCAPPAGEIVHEVTREGVTLLRVVRLPGARSRAAGAR